MQILKVLVGSQAHGLATEDSDYDYRGVFITPTMDFFKVGGAKVKETEWLEGVEDNTSYEIGHFLNLATRCNPSALEVFAAPVIETTPVGMELRLLFPSIWNSKGVLDAFMGYNQQKKMLDDKYESRERKWKFAVAYLRTLVQGIHLFRDDELIVQMPAEWNSILRDVKKGEWSEGMVLDEANRLRTHMFMEYEHRMDKVTDHAAITEFLQRMRFNNFWEVEEN